MPAAHPAPFMPFLFQSMAILGKAGLQGYPNNELFLLLPVFTVPSHDRLHSAGQTIAQAARSSQGKRAGLGPRHGTLSSGGARKRHVLNGLSL